MEKKEIILSSEEVARILSKEWFVKDVLVHTAFMLNHGEAYLSVNRLAIESFESDVKDFVCVHEQYSFDGCCRLARLNVGSVRAIEVKVGDTEMKIDVEVEPRSIHTKSHAGIFTRFQNQNIKRGQMLKFGPVSEEVSADTILLEVRSQLLALSKVESHRLLPI